ncbi:hypothetical protein BDY19DRAFT_920218 [Irpex rosettiformis]|uniref:Uncharacterized protein n=1 Tax=Irpex rosettiformis TaxID=378272 RepID=A0ACB8UIT0_9APHY|nr:hypothetical protein BDY19DRAFT_920218 [Irpex rosettiformis]
MFHSTSNRSSYYSQAPPQSSHSRPHRHHSHSHSQSRPHTHSHSYSNAPVYVSSQQPPAYNVAPQSQWPMDRNQLYQVFQQVDTDRSGAISVTELQRALRNEDWQPFDLDTVKMLMDYFDRDHSGTISFDEFAGLFKYIFEWQQVFARFDRDNSHTIDRGELQAALSQFGYNLSPHLYSIIVHKYSSLPTTEYGPSPGITFDRFVRACVSIKWLTEAFQRRDTDRDGWITVNYEDFMKVFFEAP